MDPHNDSGYEADTEVKKDKKIKKYNKTIKIT